MRKGSFRDNIGKLACLLPRPKMDGKWIAKNRNFWLIVEEYGQADGIVVLNKVTDHGGQIPYDSIRKWQEPDIVILWSQVNVGKNGLFELSPFIDGPETEMLVEGEEFLSERLNFAKKRLNELTENEIKLLAQLVIQVKMGMNEIRAFCFSIGILYQPTSFFNQLMYKTRMIEKDDPRNPLFTAWIKDGFVPILESLLFPSPVNSKDIAHPPSLPSTPESEHS